MFVHSNEEKDVFRSASLRTLLRAPLPLRSFSCINNNIHRNENVSKVVRRRICHRDRDGFCMQPIRSPELLKEDDDDDDDDDSDERVMTLVSSFSFLFQMFAFRSASVYFFSSSIWDQIQAAHVDSHQHLIIHLLQQLRPIPIGKVREKTSREFVCVCFACWTYKFSPPKSISPLSLSLHLFNLLWQVVVVVARSLACDKKTWNDKADEE